MMKAKLPFLLIFCILCIGVGWVLWPESPQENFELVAVESDTSELSEAGAVIDSSKDSGEQDAERIAADGADDVPAGKELASSQLESASVKVMINQRSVGVPMAFNWQAEGEPVQVLISDSFGRLEIPGGGQLSGKLELPTGLDWAQSSKQATAAGANDQGEMYWQPETPLAQFDLIRLPGWHGRLLNPDSDEGGVVEAELMYRQSQVTMDTHTELSLDWTSGRSLGTSGESASVKTDFAGGFFVRLVEKRGIFESLTLNLLSAPIVGGYSRTWLNEELPEDGWLGSLSMQAGGPLWVHVVDGDGIPLPDAKISMQGSNADATEQVGTYYFDGVLPVPSKISASAENFRPTSLEVKPPFAGTPYRLELLPNTRIEIHVLESTEFPISDPHLSLNVAGSPGFLDGDGKPTGSIRLSVGDITSSMSFTNAEGSVSQWQAEIVPEDGKAVLTGVRPDIPLQLQIMGGLGPLAELEIPPRESDVHFVEITPQRGSRTVHGRVLSDDGLPVIGGSVNFMGGNNQNKHVMTGPTGSFSLDGVCLDELDLRFSAGGFLSLDVDNHQVATDGDLGTFRLSLARKLRLHFVYIDGSDAHEGMAVHWECGEKSGQQSTKAKGYLTLKRLPQHLPVELSWTHGGSPGTRRIEVGEDKVRIELPDTGKLSIKFSNLATDSLPDHCLLCLQKPGAAAPTEEDPNGFSVPVTGPVQLPHVLASEYRVALFRHRESEDDQAGIFERISEYSNVEVIAQQSTSVELRLLDEE